MIWKLVRSNLRIHSPPIHIQSVPFLRIASVHLVPSLRMREAMLSFSLTSTWRGCSGNDITVTYYEAIFFFFSWKGSPSYYWLVCFSGTNICFKVVIREVACDIVLCDRPTFILRLVDFIQLPRPYQSDIEVRSWHWEPNSFSTYVFDPKYEYDAKPYLLLSLIAVAIVYRLKSTRSSPCV